MCKCGVVQVCVSATDPPIRAKFWMPTRCLVCPLCGETSVSKSRYYIGDILEEQAWIDYRAAVVDCAEHELHRGRGSRRSSRRDSGHGSRSQKGRKIRFNNEPLLLSLSRKKTSRALTCARTCGRNEKAAQNV